MPMASSCPVAVAHRVARDQSVSRPSSPRSMRPPSSGNAGIMLNSTSPMLAPTSHCTAPSSDGGAPSGRSSAGVRSTRPSPASQTIGASSATMTTLTAGPAAAIISSSKGRRVARPRNAMPPIGSRTISFTGMPKDCAARACPNSCSVTQANSSSTRPTPNAMPAGPKAAQLAAASSTMNANVRCTFRVMPRMVARRSDQFMTNPLPVKRARPATHVDDRLWRHHEQIDSSSAGHRERR